MSTLYLSRITLDRNAPTSALADLLDPAETAGAMDAHHRLIWTLFADTPDRKRDFLWRADGRGRFYVLSVRQPISNTLFQPIETKAFEPVLKKNDRLAFSLRVNATRDRARGQMDSTQPHKNRRVDIVMHALREIPGHKKGDRAAKRLEKAQIVAHEWMIHRSTTGGFKLDDLVVNNYSVIALPRRKKQHANFGVLDLSGILIVTEPETFLARLGIGFGRAKAFGCGLMLIRRA